jgi:hypothetical protein
MEFWTNLWSFATAAGTLALAVATYAIIRQGQKLREDSELQRKDTERQHRDRLKPICVLMPYDYVDSWNKRGELIKTIPPNSENPGFGRVMVNCTLRNVGTGPALRLRLKFRFLDKNGWSTEPWELSPLGAGEQYGSLSAPLVIPLRLQGAFNETDFSAMSNNLWEIWLEYQDVFGRKFESVHSKAPLDPNLSAAKWATLPGENQPRADLRALAWFTYVEPNSL